MYLRCNIIGLADLDQRASVSLIAVCGHPAAVLTCHSMSLSCTPTYNLRA